MNVLQNIADQLQRGINARANDVTTASTPNYNERCMQATGYQPRAGYQQGIKGQEFRKSNQSAADATDSTPTYTSCTEAQKKHGKQKELPRRKNIYTPGSNAESTRKAHPRRYNMYTPDTQSDDDFVKVASIENSHIEEVPCDVYSPIYRKESSPVQHYFDDAHAGWSSTTSTENKDIYTQLYEAQLMLKKMIAERQRDEQYY